MTYVDPTERDLLLFQIILEQKFLTKIQVIDHIFKGRKSYAEIRIRKLKKFGYLKPLKRLIGEPESYLLGSAGVEALRERGYAIGTMGFPVKAGATLPLPQKEIELAYYGHDKKMTDIRFLLEGLGFGENWHSEKLLKLGRKGERKVPDALILKQGSEKLLRIALELELHEKSKRKYEKIIYWYRFDSDCDFIFYICGSATIRYKLIKLTQGSSKTFFFFLYDDLMKNREKAELLGSLPGRMTFGDLL